MEKPQNRTMPSLLPLLGLVGIVGCAGISVSFHRTDSSFQSAPNSASGDLPAVYMNEKDVPPVPVRSVGIISVDGGTGMPLQEFARKVAVEGRRLGCWAVVEHSAFLMLQRETLSWLFERGGSVIRVHGEGGGGGGSGGHTTGSGRQTRRFDCVVRDDLSA